MGIVIHVQPVPYVVRCVGIAPVCATLIPARPEMEYTVAKDEHQPHIGLDNRALIAPTAGALKTPVLATLFGERSDQPVVVSPTGEILYRVLEFAALGE